MKGNPPKLLLIFLLLLPFFSVFGKESDRKIKVATNTNIETLMICYELAENGGWHFPSSYCHPLNEVARERFKIFREHEAIITMNELLKKGFWLDKMVKVMLVSEPFPIGNTDFKLSEKDASLVADTPQEANLIIEEFVLQLSAFYRDAELQSFFRDYSEYYLSVNEEVRAHLPDDGLIENMEQFYGSSAAAYQLIPSPIMKMTLGFGPRVKNDEGMVVYNVFGPLVLTTDPKEYGYGYGSKQKILRISRHEFGHSFVNPIMELSENRELIQQYAYLYEPIKDKMKELGYTTWWTCVTEHIVRLGEVRLSGRMEEAACTRKLRDYQVEKKGFVYLPYLEECIREYENNREQYPSLATFMPVLLSSFEHVQNTEKQEISWLLVLKYVVRSIF